MVSSFHRFSRKQWASLTPEQQAAYRLEGRAPERDERQWRQELDLVQRKMREIGYEGVESTFDN